jgi:hypothetical protein
MSVRFRFRLVEELLVLVTGVQDFELIEVGREKLKPIPALGLLPLEPNQLIRILLTYRIGLLLRLRDLVDELIQAVEGLLLCLDLVLQERLVVRDIAKEYLGFRLCEPFLNGRHDSLLYLIVTQLD